MGKYYKKVANMSKLIKKYLVVLFACVLSLNAVVIANGNVASLVVERLPIVVVDAGHGGRDGGVVGKITKVKESDLNLAISFLLQQLLQDNGFEVYMTRTTDEGLYGEAKANRKMKDLRARESLINSVKPDLMVSIHHNSFHRSLERGAQVFYSVGCDKQSASQLVARTVQATLNSALLESDRVAKKGDFYIINCTMFPSVLVECGFLSTPAEEELLVTKEYQARIAQAIFDGIKQSFLLKNCATN